MDKGNKKILIRKDIMNKWKIVINLTHGNG